jgi:hypothetical protein
LNQNLIIPSVEEIYAKAAIYISSVVVSEGKISGVDGMQMQARDSKLEPVVFK